MTAMITDDSYGQQVTNLFDMLKLASPEQLQNLAQSAQQNPQSPEATALAMATQYQQQAGAQQQQSPTQTVFQQKIEQLKQRMNPMQGGITDVGANQYAMQDAAQQDPMRNAGIGAAPENAPPPPEGAATGGLIALAQGGPIRHFFMGGSGSSQYEVPEYGTDDYPEEEEESDEGTPVDPEGVEDAQQAFRAKREADYNEDVPESTLTDEEEAELPPAKLASNTRPRQDTGVINPPRPGSSAERIQSKAAQDKLLETAVEDIVALNGPAYAVSAELQGKLDRQLSDANKDKWFNALAQGIGGMLSAQTPYLSQAAGAGLLAGAAGYQQGAKEEADLQKQQLALQLAQEKERHADRRSAVNTVVKQIHDTEMAKKKFERDLALKNVNVKVAEILAGKAGANTYATTAEEVQKIILDRAKAYKDDPHSQYFRKPIEDIYELIAPQIMQELRQQGAQFNPRGGGGAPRDPMRDYGVITGGGFLG
mgnify:CR=1 FL=1